MLCDRRLIIRNATNKEDIIDAIRHAKTASIADRSVYLDKLSKNKFEEKPIDIESLRMSALFIIDNSYLPNPQITTSDDGLVYLRWSLKNEGVLGMLFLPSTLVRFTATLHHQDQKSQRWSVNGTLQPNDMMNTIEPFMEQLMHNT